MRRARLARGLALLVLLVVAADQVVDHTLLADGEFLGHRVMPFDPPLFTEWQRNAAREVAAIVAGDTGRQAHTMLDPELGWCPRPGQDLGLYVHDWAGARVQLGPLAREKESGVRRVVAVGCSFTQGAEVAGAETWSALLDARRADLEVANLGVAGYGIDQALLRFRRDGRVLAPDEVWLGFMPGATLRIATQYPPALFHWSSVLTFKPLLRLTPEETLELVPAPARDYGSMATLLGDQAAFFDALVGSDPWIQRAPAAYAPRGSSWTHCFATTRLLLTVSEAGERDPYPYLRDERCEVHRTLRAIVLALAHDAADGGARFRLLVLPSRRDLEEAAGGDAPWAGLVAELVAAGVATIDLTPRLLAAGAADDAGFWMPAEHYSAAGNRVVAEALEAELALAPPR